MEIKKTHFTIIYILGYFIFYLLSLFLVIRVHNLSTNQDKERIYSLPENEGLYILYKKKINKCTDHMSTNIRRWAYLYCLIYFIHLDPLMYGCALIYIEDQLLCVYGIIKCITYMMWLMLWSLSLKPSWIFKQFIFILRYILPSHANISNWGSSALDEIQTV